MNFHTLLRNTTQNQEMAMFQLTETLAKINPLAGGMLTSVASSYAGYNNTLFAEYEKSCYRNEGPCVAMIDTLTNLDVITKYPTSADFKTYLDTYYAVDTTKEMFETKHLEQRFSFLSQIDWSLFAVGENVTYRDGVLTVVFWQGNRKIKMSFHGQNNNAPGQRISVSGVEYYHDFEKMWCNIGYQNNIYLSTMETVMAVLLGLLKKPVTVCRPLKDMDELNLVMSSLATRLHACASSFLINIGHEDSFTVTVPTTEGYGWKLRCVENVPILLGTNPGKLTIESFNITTPKTFLEHLLKAYRNTFAETVNDIREKLGTTGLVVVDGVEKDMMTGYNDVVKTMNDICAESIQSISTTCGISNANANEKTSES